MVNSMTNETYATLYEKIKTLNKQWFYEKTEVDTILAGYIAKSQTAGLVKNDGTIDSNSYALSSHNHDNDYAQKSHEHSQYLTSANISGKEDTSNKSSSITTDTGSTTKYPTVKAVEDYAQPKGNYLTEHQDISGKANSADLATVATSGSYTDLTNKPELATVATSGSYNDLSNKPTIPTVPTTVSSFTNDAGYLTQHQSLDSKTVTVEEQSTAESGSAKTYVVKQGGSQVGVKINIPKDFFVRSGELKTVTSADLTTLGSGYAVDDKYLDFVINYADDSGTPEHMYINVKDLVDDTTVTWNAIQNKPSVFAPDTHAHGNITNSGTITTTGTNAGNIVVTDNNNAVVVQSAIDVVGGIIDGLIDYGTPEEQP